MRICRPPANCCCKTRGSSSLLSWPFFQLFTAKIHTLVSKVRFLLLADPFNLRLFCGSLGALPVTDRGCATQGTDPLPPSSPVAKEHLLCGRKRVFTRKGFPSLPPRRCVSRHAAGDRHWPCSTGGCAVVSKKAENSTPSAREG